MTSLATADQPLRRLGSDDLRTTVRLVDGAPAPREEPSVEEVSLRQLEKWLSEAVSRLKLLPLNLAVAVLDYSSFVEHLEVLEVVVAGQSVLQRCEMIVRQLVVLAKQIFLRPGGRDTDLAKYLEALFATEIPAVLEQLRSAAPSLPSLKGRRTPIHPFFQYSWDLEQLLAEIG